MRLFSNIRTNIQEHPHGRQPLPGEQWLLDGVNAARHPLPIGDTFLRPFIMKCRVTYCIGGGCGTIRSCLDEDLFRRWL